MNKKELAKFKKAIEAEREKVLHDLGILGEEINSLSSSKGSRKQGYSNHMADIGTDSMEQEQTFLHASQGYDYLNALESALKRIENGTYGICADCSGKIPTKRLEAYLAAELCITCKAKREKQHRN